MNINSWPIHDRPREKLLSQGPAALSDSELLAIFIRTGIKGKSAIDIARILLQKFGNLRNLLNCKAEELYRTSGFGKAKYAEIQAALELSRRHLAANLEHQNIINNRELAQQFLSAKMRNLRHEVFACIFLDVGNQIISFEVLFEGTINNATVYPRKIVQRALELNAAAIIFAHNHTAGPAIPSISDKQLTKELTNLLEILDIKVLDHIIIGQNNCFSFMKENLII